MKILWGEEGHRTEERDRVRDFINKLSAGFRMLLPNTIHVFEDLDKGDMVSRMKRGGRGIIERPGKEYIEGYQR